MPRRRRYEFYGVYELPRTLEALNPLLDSFSTSTTTTDPTEPSTD